MLHFRLHSQAGEGRPLVVLLHGMGSCGEDWPLQLAVLTDRYRVLTVDLPGHGASPMLVGWPTVDDLARPVVALLEATDPDPAHIVGLSLGGLVATQIAIHRADRVRSLVLANSFARLRPTLRGILYNLVRLGLLLSAPMSWVGRWVAVGLFPRREQEAVRRLAARRIAGNPRRSYLQIVRAVVRYDARAELERIRCPVLVVAGDRDGTIPLRAKRDLARGISGARLEIVRGSGHATPIDAPQAFNALLLGFLEEVDRGKPRRNRSGPPSSGPAQSASSS